MHVMELPRRMPGLMRTACRRLALTTLLGLLAVAGSHAASLDPSVLPQIQAATFEVVAAKPVKDPLTYEKPLPLELLPFQERNDKYYSIGTAFALGNNRYVTAAHVLQVGIEQQLERLERDTHRPLLADTDRRARLQSMAQVREPLYQRIADLVAPAGSGTIANAGERCIDLINHHWQRQPIRPRPSQIA